MNFHKEPSDTSARYVAGTLSQSETDGFEQHLLLCEACRNDVRLADLLRSELPSAGRKSSTWVAAAGLAIAASLAIVFLRPGSNPVTELGAVSSAPTYDGVPVRASTGGSDSIFAAAMSLYKRQSYEQSAEKFAEARAAGSDSVTTTFFRGVSQLMAGQPVDASAELERAARMNSSLYSDEARYYAAKAWLHAGKKEEALRALYEASTSEGPTRSRAASLADSVRAVR